MTLVFTPFGVGSKRTKKQTHAKDGSHAKRREERHVDPVDEGLFVRFVPHGKSLIKVKPVIRPLGGATLRIEQIDESRRIVRLGIVFFFAG